MRCLHSFVPCDKRNYEVCADCGTYHSLSAPPPEMIYDSHYWSEKRGHSTIEDQVHNVEIHEEGGISKNQFVQDRIIIHERSSALEVGCAPGSFLARLSGQLLFDTVVGVETDRAYRRSILKIAGPDCDLIFGFFPRTTRMWYSEKVFDLIVGMDIFEHVHHPEEFLKECHRLLKPGGQLLLMLPIAWRGEESLPARFFDPVEHVFLHTAVAMRQMLEEFGFSGILLDKWTAGHDTVSALKI